VLRVRDRSQAGVTGHRGGCVCTARRRPPDAALMGPPARRVKFLGYIENPYMYMLQADRFLLSSRSEGLPTVLIEALPCGCPVVATNCSSCVREILNGETVRFLSACERFPDANKQIIGCAVAESLFGPASGQSQAIWSGFSS
jgi:glycosyltransferase involved in cell wall biosynthesis